MIEHFVAEPKTLQRMVERIIQLLEGQQAKVTTLDYSKLFDNREPIDKIDMTIVRDSMLTLVELRGRGLEEPDKWLFSLARKRQYLSANAAIAVYGDELSADLRAEAEENGILLRPLHELREEEIVDWGRPVDIALVHVHFSRIRIRIGIDRKYADDLSQAPVLGIVGLDSERDPISVILLQICEQIEAKLSKEWQQFNVGVGLDSMTVDGIPTQQLTLNFHARLENEATAVSSVIVHNRATEQDSNHMSNLLADFSMFRQKNNRVLRHISFDGPQVRGSFSCKLVGVAKLERAEFGDVVLDVFATEESAADAPKMLSQADSVGDAGAGNGGGRSRPDTMA